MYNQIKAAECRNDCNLDHLAEWKAGFIEDADELHLASKPHFASIIRAWAGDPGVAASFEKDAAGGMIRFSQVLVKANNAWARNARRETAVIPASR